MSDAPRRNRTVQSDLQMLVAVLRELNELRAPARIELSADGDRVTAQLMADRVARPLVGVGRDAPAALRDLVDEINAAVDLAARRGVRRQR